MHSHTIWKLDCFSYLKSWPFGDIWFSQDNNHMLMQMYIPAVYCEDVATVYQTFALTGQLSSI